MPNDTLLVVNEAGKAVTATCVAHTADFDTEHIVECLVSVFSLVELQE